jgi:hydroxymethylbilane synthase
VYSLDGTVALTASHASVWPDDDAAFEVASAAARELLDAGAADLTGAVG